MMNKLKENYKNVEKIFEASKKVDFIYPLIYSTIEYSDFYLVTFKIDPTNIEFIELKNIIIKFDVYSDGNIGMDFVVSGGIICGRYLFGSYVKELDSYLIYFFHIVNDHIKSLENLYTFAKSTEIPRQYKIKTLLDD